MCTLICFLLLSAMLGSPWCLKCNFTYIRCGKQVHLKYLFSGISPHYNLEWSGRTFFRMLNGTSQSDWCRMWCRLIFLWGNMCWVIPFILKLNKIFIIQAKISITSIGITQEVIIRTAIESKNVLSVSSTFLVISDMPFPILEMKLSSISVSYTHLTLPTNREV